MSSERHFSGTPILRLRRKAIYMASGIYAATLVTQPVLAFAASDVDINVARVQESGSPTTEQIDDDTRWKIIRIIAPENDQELGVIVFGEGQSLIEPSSIRGPR